MLQVSLPPAPPEVATILWQQQNLNKSNIEKLAQQTPATPSIEIENDPNRDRFLQPAPAPVHHNIKTCHINRHQQTFTFGYFQRGFN